MLFGDGNQRIAKDKFIQPINDESHMLILGNVTVALEMQQPCLVSRYVLGLPNRGFTFNIDLWVGELGFRRIFRGQNIPYEEANQVML